MILPKKENYMMPTSELGQMKKALARATPQSEKEQKDKASLLMPEKDVPSRKRPITNPASPSTKWAHTRRGST